MELHALHWEPAMPQSHNDGFAKLITAGRHLEIVGQVFLLHNQRMVTIGNEGGIQPAKNRAAIMLYQTGFAMHDASRTPDPGAEGRSNGLMTETYSQNRNLRSKFA